MSQHIESHLSTDKFAAEEIANQRFSQATKELHEHLETPLNEVAYV